MQEFLTRSESVGFCLSLLMLMTANLLSRRGGHIAVIGERVGEGRSARLM